MRKRTDALTLTHGGSHHSLHVDYNPKTKAVMGGGVANFSDHTSLGMNFTQKGKVSGSFVHAGEHHAINATMADNGKFSAEYFDKKKSLKIGFNGGMARILEGKPSVGKIVAEGKSHKLDMEINKAGKVSGTLTTKTKMGAELKMEMKNGKLTRAGLVHSGATHYTSVTVDGTGKWKAMIGTKQKSGGFNIGVTGGNGKMRAVGTMGWKF